MIIKKRLQAYGLRPSTSGKGNCCDNALVETFFKTIKAELIWRRYTRIAKHEHPFKVA